MTTLRTLMHDDFNANQFVLTPDLTQGQFTCRIPFGAAKRIEFLLLSSNVGDSASDNFHAEKITSKNFLKVYEDDAPQTNEFSFTMNYPEGTGLTLDVLAEIEGSLQTNLSRSVFSKDVLEITPVHVDGDRKILSDGYFNGKTLRLKVNDGIAIATIHDGTLEVAALGKGTNMDKKNN